MIHIVNDDITISKGNNLVLNVELFNGSEKYTIGENERLIFSVKYHINDTKYTIQKDIVDGVLVLSPEELDLSVGRYVYDLVLIGNNTKDTLIGPKSLIIKEVVNNEL